MADVIDIANDRAQADLDAALAARIVEPVNMESALYCQECDDQIPEKRRELVKGCQLCVHCQSLAESLNRSRGFW